MPICRHYSKPSNGLEPLTPSYHVGRARQYGPKDATNGLILWFSASGQQAAPKRRLTRGSGARARDVAVVGRTLTIAPMPPRGMLCNSLVEGTARVVLTAAAGIGNPRARERYALTVTRSVDTQTARLRIES